MLGYLSKNTREVASRRERQMMITLSIVRYAREAREVAEGLRGRLDEFSPLFERDHPGGARY